MALSRVTWERGVTRADQSLVYGLTDLSQGEGFVHGSCRGHIQLDNTVRLHLMHDRASSACCPCTRDLAGFFGKVVVLGPLLIAKLSKTRTH
jgi:hypothetical protein